MAAEDLEAGRALMDRFDASLGNSDAVYSCLEQIAYRGGWKGVDGTMRESIDSPGSTRHVQQRPWRYWSEVARAANASADHVLAGRIFLFAYLFTTQMASRMSWQDRLSIGLEAPDDVHYRTIATSAVDSLSRLDPQTVLHETATGKVDVAHALAFAEGVAGVTADRPARPAQVDGGSDAPAGSYDSPFNPL